MLIVTDSTNKTSVQSQCYLARMKPIVETMNKLKQLEIYISMYNAPA